MANRILLRPGAVRLAYGAVVALFLWCCWQCHIPGQGFTFFVMFGSTQSAHALPELRRIDHAVEKDSGGYDAQYYAQLAMHPQLHDRTIRRAVDNLAYRARRMLFCWTAYVLGGGDPARALRLFAVQNIVCWLLLAGLLLRWFPPVDWDNFVRWAGLLLCFGLCFSVRGALLDGPSLLLIAAGMALAEAGRPWLAAAVLGISGLGKETNVLAGAIFAPDEAGRIRLWRRSFVQGVIVVAPLLVWLIVLQVWVGRGADAGARNFDWPFAAYLRHWRDVLSDLITPGYRRIGGWGAVMMVTLTAQWLFFALRPRWSSAWWRLGAAYAVLMMFLGDAVWEGFPGAAGRVVLPMALAFNVLVPRGRRWLVLLLAGNLSLVVTPATFDFPRQDSYFVEGPGALQETADGRVAIRVSFDAQWGPPEKSLLERWRWSRGRATLALENRDVRPRVADVSLRLRADEPRTVLIKQGGRVLATVGLRPKEPVDVALPGVLLPPGRTVWTLAPAPGSPAPEDANHWFSLRNLTLRLRPAVDAQ